MPLSKLINDPKAILDGEKAEGLTSQVSHIDTATPDSKKPTDVKKLAEYKKLAERKKERIIEKAKLLRDRGYVFLPGKHDHYFNIYNRDYTSYKSLRTLYKLYGITKDNLDKAQEDGKDIIKKYVRKTFVPMGPRGVPLVINEETNSDDKLLNLWLEPVIKSMPYKKYFEEYAYKTLVDKAEGKKENNLFDKTNREKKQETIFVTIEKPYSDDYSDLDHPQLEKKQKDNIIELLKYVEDDFQDENTPRPIKVFIIHIRNLFPKDRETQAYIFWFIKMTVLHPDIKVAHAPLIFGGVRIGKTAMLVLINSLLASVDKEHGNGTATDVDNILGKFNRILEGKCFVGVNEIEKESKPTLEKFFGKAKTLITDETIWIEPKGIDSYPIDNIINFYFITNNPGIFNKQLLESRIVFCGCANLIAGKSLEHQKEYFDQLFYYITGKKKKWKELEITKAKKTPEEKRTPEEKQLLFEIEKGKAALGTIREFLEEMPQHTFYPNQKPKTKATLEQVNTASANVCDDQLLNDYKEDKGIFQFRIGHIKEALALYQTLNEKTAHKSKWLKYNLDYFKHALVTIQIENENLQTENVSLGKIEATLYFEVYFEESKDFKKSRVSVTYWILKNCKYFEGNNNPNTIKALIYRNIEIAEKVEDGLLRRYIYKMHKNVIDKLYGKHDENNMYKGYEKLKKILLKDTEVMKAYKKLPIWQT